MEPVYKKLIGKCIQELHIYQSNDSRIGQGENVNYVVVTTDTMGKFGSGVALVRLWQVFLYLLHQPSLDMDCPGEKGMNLDKGSVL